MAASRLLKLRPKGASPAWNLALQFRWERLLDSHQDFHLARST